MPVLEGVAEEVWSVGLAMSGAKPPHYSLCYLILDGHSSVHLIDPGQDSVENWERLVQALQLIGKSIDDVASITATHRHSDHLGMAERLRAASGAPIGLHAVEQEALFQSQVDAKATNRFEGWGVPLDRQAGMDDSGADRLRVRPFTADVLLEHDDSLGIPGRELCVISTPGHTGGHICIRLPDSGLLITGDHVLPTIQPGVGLGTATSNSLAEYLDSLHLVASYDADEVCPGHGFRFRGLAERCAKIERYHQRRSQEVTAALVRNPDASVWQISEQVTWSGGWHNLRGRYLQAALAQIGMHVGLLNR